MSGFNPIGKGKGKGKGNSPRNAEQPRKGSLEEEGDDLAKQEEAFGTVSKEPYSRPLAAAAAAFGSKNIKGETRKPTGAKTIRQLSLGGSFFELDLTTGKKRYSINTANVAATSYEDQEIVSWMKTFVGKASNKTGIRADQFFYGEKTAQKIQAAIDDYKQKIEMHKAQSKTAGLAPGIIEKAKQMMADQIEVAVTQDPELRKYDWKSILADTKATFKAGLAKMSSAAYTAKEGMKSAASTAKKGMESGFSKAREAASGLKAKAKEKTGYGSSLKEESRSARVDSTTRERSNSGGNPKPAFLNDIAGAKLKGTLKKVVTNDRSAPNFTISKEEAAKRKSSGATAASQVSSSSSRIAPPPGMTQKPMSPGVGQKPPVPLRPANLSFKGQQAGVTQGSFKQEQKPASPKAGDKPIMTFASQIQQQKLKPAPQQKAQAPAKEESELARKLRLQREKSDKGPKKQS